MNNDLQFFGLLLGSLAVGIGGCVALAVVVAAHQISVTTAIVCGGVVLLCWACLLSAILGCFEV